MEEVNKSINQIPPSIANAKKNDWLHVFLINGPVSLITSRMIIDTYDLKEKNIFISCTRKTDTSIISLLSFTPDNFWYDRYFEKILSIKLKAFRILRKILTRKKNFILYCAWAELGTEIFIDSNYCKGHIHLEEGQASHWQIKPFRYKRKLFFTSIPRNIYFIFMNRFRYTSRKKSYYRDDAMAFIGLTKDSFPLMPKERRFILKNYAILKKQYNPKLLGINTIGLTCAERRLKPHQWKTMLKALVERMPEGGVIKLHPSFCIDQDKVKKMKSLLVGISSKNIKICDDSVIIEIEMLYEKKKLIGALTSLSIYADAFGSIFEDINLY